MDTCLHCAAKPAAGAAYTASLQCMMLYGHFWADTWFFMKSRVMCDLRK
eukprot:IDg12703t1